MDKRCQKDAFTERKKTQVKQKDEHLCIQEEKKKKEKESDLREPPSNPGTRKEIPPRGPIAEQDSQWRRQPFKAITQDLQN